MSVDPFAGSIMITWVMFCMFALVVIPLSENESRLVNMLTLSIACLIAQPALVWMTCKMLVPE